MTIEQEREELMKRTPTLRDWFAAAALSGILAADPALTSDQIAFQTFRLADAMLAERKKKGAQ